jgi:hypothetical protein
LIDGSVIDSKRHGYVMSDWGGTHSGVASIEGGLDMNMPGGLGPYGLVPEAGSFFGKNVSLETQLFLEQAVECLGVLTSIRTIQTLVRAHKASRTVTDVIQEAVSSNIDDRTMHELYLWPFANAVRAQAASFMSHP